MLQDHTTYDKTYRFIRAGGGNLAAVASPQWLHCSDMECISWCKGSYALSALKSATKEKGIPR